MPVVLAQGRQRLHTMSTLRLGDARSWMICCGPGHLDHGQGEWERDGRGQGSVMIDGHDQSHRCLETAWWGTRWSQLGGVCVEEYLRERD